MTPFMEVELRISMKAGPDSRSLPSVGRRIEPVAGSQDWGAWLSPARWTPILSSNVPYRASGRPER